MRSFICKGKPMSPVRPQYLPVIAALVVELSNFSRLWPAIVYALRVKVTDNIFVNMNVIFRMHTTWIFTMAMVFCHRSGLFAMCESFDSYHCTLNLLFFNRTLIVNNSLWFGKKTNKSRWSLENKQFSLSQLQA